ncbi:MAG: nucleoside deaminase, partial [Bradyrhizobium sp.]
MSVARPDGGSGGIVIGLPGWVDDLVRDAPTSFDDDVSRMDLAIALSRASLQRGGAPFGAAVFAGPKLVAAGVNRVQASGLSFAHAEMIALARAQRVIGRSRVPINGPFALVTSTEPCCQCLGALFF